MDRCASFMAAVFLFALPSFVAKGGEQGHYVPGSWSPRDLISAPDGLQVFAPYLSYYSAGKARTGNGATVDASQGVDVGADSWMFTPVLVYSPATKLFDADWAITVVPAYGEAGANARLTAFGQDITLFDNNKKDWGDLYVIPANLTWHLNPMLVLATGATISEPQYLFFHSTTLVCCCLHLYCMKSMAVKKALTSSLLLTPRLSWEPLWRFPRNLC
jgi:hypothetical protein